MCQQPLIKAMMYCLTNFKENVFASDLFYSIKTIQYFNDYCQMGEKAKDYVKKRQKTKKILFF